jgi:hypothetical protein
MNRDNGTSGGGSVGEWDLVDIQRRAYRYQLPRMSYLSPMNTTTAPRTHTRPSITYQRQQVYVGLTCPPNSYDVDLRNGKKMRLGWLLGSGRCALVTRGL